MRLIKDSESKQLAEVALWGGRLEAEMRKHKSGVITDRQRSLKLDTCNRIFTQC